jgi:hypothetical protein
LIKRCLLWHFSITWKSSVAAALLMFVVRSRLPMAATRMKSMNLFTVVGSHHGGVVSISRTKRLNLRHIIYIVIVLKFLFVFCAFCIGCHDCHHRCHPGQGNYQLPLHTYPLLSSIKYYHHPHHITKHILTRFNPTSSSRPNPGTLQAEQSLYQARNHPHSGTEQLRPSAFRSRFWRFCSRAGQFGGRLD